MPFKLSGQLAYAKQFWIISGSKPISALIVSNIPNKIKHEKNKFGPRMFWTKNDPK